MGIEAAIATAITLQVGAGFISGITANKAGKQQQKLLEKQADIAVVESKKEAGRLRRIFKIQNANRKLGFFKQGVAIFGSPSSIISTSINLQSEEVVSVLDRGTAQANLLRAQGRIARSQGRAQLIGSIFGGVASGVGTFATAKAFGAFPGKFGGEGLNTNTISGFRDVAPGTAIS